jgi:competence protein ComEA
MEPRRLVRAVRGAGAAAARATASLAGSLAYRRQELTLIALLAASVVGGFGIEAWHRRAPALLDRLEGEPPRLAPGPAVRHAPVRPARAAPRRPARAERPASRAPAARGDPEAPLDLDRATPAELTRLPGIGPRLAARIAARRDELGGRFPSFGDFASVPGIGARRAGLLRSRLRVAADAEAVTGPLPPPP